MDGLTESQLIWVNFSPRQVLSFFVCGIQVSDHDHIYVFRVVAFAATFLPPLQARMPQHGSYTSVGIAVTSGMKARIARVRNMVW